MLSFPQIFFELDEFIPYVDKQDEMDKKGNHSNQSLIIGHNLLNS